MGLASILQWLPLTNGNDNDTTAVKIRPEQWQVLAEARQKRLPLVLFTTPEKRGQGFGSFILKLQQKNNMVYIDLPHPGLPSDYRDLPKRLYATLKSPGTYQHWHIEGSIIERADANDGPFLKFRIDEMNFCDDRRRQTRFNFADNAALISCLPPMETPIYGDVDNISLGGICFKARGNLQQSDAFYLAHHGQKTQIPVDIQLNEQDRLSAKIEVLAMQVIKKPYLHTRIRARFSELNDSQSHILAALTQKSTETA